MGMDFKISFKTKITVNGKEYGSMDEVPEEHRETVRNALDSAATPFGRSKITVNGVGYDSVEAMPPDVRKKHEEILKKAEAEALRSGTTLSAMGIRPETPPKEGGLSLRTTIILVLLAGLLLLLKFYGPK